MMSRFPISYIHNIGIYNITLLCFSWDFQKKECLGMVNYCCFVVVVVVVVVVDDDGQKSYLIVQQWTLPELPVGKRWNSCRKGL